MITLVPPMDPSNEQAVAVTNAHPEGVLEDAKYFLLHKTLFIGFIHVTTLLKAAKYVVDIIDNSRESFIVC